MPDAIDEPSRMPSNDRAYESAPDNAFDTCESGADSECDEPGNEWTESTIEPFDECVLAERSKISMRKSRKNGCVFRRFSRHPEHMPIEKALLGRMRITFAIRSLVVPSMKARPEDRSTLECDGSKRRKKTLQEKPASEGAV
jgi:hypothetical protein